MISTSIQQSLNSVLIAAAYSASTCACAMAQQPADLFSPIIEVHEDQENTGLAVVLRSCGQMIESAYLGSAVIEHDVKVTSETRFQVMSITKAFVGAVLVKSASANLVDLDVPVQTYLPDFQASAEGDITLRSLAAHTSGLTHLSHPDRRNLYVQHFEDARSSLQAFEDLSLAYEPGTAYSYSSAGYTVIAAVLEVVHDKPFPEILEEIVLQPLDLRSTGSGNAQTPIPDLARSYSYIDIWTYQPVERLLQVPTWDFSYNLGGGNLVTTAEDLAKFGEAFIKPGFFSGEELSLITTQIAPEHSRWGMGWFVNQTEDGETFLSISGATPGVQAGLSVYPESETVIVALSNAWGRNSAGGDLVIGAPQRILDGWQSRDCAIDNQ